jgi:tetratricopeptide (TPR) repeat protein
LLDNSIGRAFLPPWLNEGLAEYYEQLEFGDNRQVKLGVSNNAHFQLLSKSKLIPLESFFAVDYYSLYRQRKENFQIFYAQAWLLVHYLIQGNGGVRLNDLGQFVNLLLQGRQPEFAFEQAFQTDYATIEDELKKYLRQKSFSTTSIKLPLDNEISVSEVSTAEVKALQGDLLYHISRFDDAEKFLQEALALNEDSGYALTTLGLIRMRQKNFSEAKRFLEKAIQANQKSFRIFYCYAVVLSREQMTENGFASGFSAESAEKMRESLHQSIALNPRFAESYNLLAFVNIVRNEEVDKSFEIIKEALAISPGNSWYQIRLAELHMLSQNFNAARKIVQRLILTASDDVLKVYAENTLVRINTLESQILSLKQRKNTGNEIITEEPVSADELARRRERAMLESLNRALRIPKADESRVLGVITKIDCSLQELVVSVQTNERQLNLRTDSLEGLTLIAFDESFAGTEFGCGVMKKQGLAVVTFRPLQTTQSKVQGEVVAIEFVPKNFRFSAPNK